MPRKAKTEPDKPYIAVIDDGCGAYEIHMIIDKKLYTQAEDGHIEIDTYTEDLEEANKIAKAHAEYFGFPALLLENKPVTVTYNGSRTKKKAKAK